LLATGHLSVLSKSRGKNIRSLRTGSDSTLIEIS
jgi:hypothetical protein